MISMIRTLEGRREALVVRALIQRERLSAQWAPAARRLAATDRVVTALRTHPVMTGLAVAGVALMGPGALWRWVVRIGSLYALVARI
jgi:hypothetical protein